jgi:hypothetical protein
MNDIQFWVVVKVLENVGLATTRFDATSHTTSILLHPGIELDLSLVQHAVYETAEIEWGSNTENGMLCTGPQDPRDVLPPVFEPCAGEDLPPYNYVLIDEAEWGGDDEDDEDA